MTTPLPETEQLITLANANTLAGRLGKTVTEEQVLTAELVISLRTGVMINDSDVVANMSTQDRYWLAQAVVFQAVWGQGQPDLLSRLDLAQSSTDGDAIVANHDGLLLSPLAKWAILRTSVMTWGTTDVAPPIISVRPDLENIGWRRTGNLW